MSHKQATKESLLVVNTKAGNGTARDVAQKITEQTGIEAIDIIDLFSVIPQAALAAHSTTETQSHRIFRQLDVLLKKYRTFFILSGDGGSFIFAKELIQRQLERPVTVVPLGLGGENVLAKHAGAYGRILESVQTVLYGRHLLQPLRPFTVGLEKVTSEGSLYTELIPEFWGAHAGTSAAVLYAIEELRSIGASDFQRRYQGAIQTMLQMRSAEPVLLSHNGIQEKVYDVGVISSALPNWTSKVQLNTTLEHPAILHTIGEYEYLQAQPVAYTARFILEMISLKFGFPLRRKIITHRQLQDNFSVSFTAPNQKVAVDSELYEAHSAVVREKARSFPGVESVFLGHIPQLK